MGQKGSNVGQPLVQAGLLGEAIDRGPVAVFVADDEMRYLAVNEYACELLGYTREELLGKTIADVSAGPDADRRFRDFVAAGEAAGTTALRRKDGSRLTIAYRAGATTVAGFTAYVSAAWPVEAPR
jgi:PAS domain S-box-containing protein